MRALERERHWVARCSRNAAVPLTPAEKENTMQCLYRCTRCGMGWLATMVEHGDCGVAVHVFLCSHCRYASQPGVPVAVQEGASAMPISVRAAMVPVARLTGPGVEALRLEELLVLLGLLPDAPESAAQRPALVPAGHAAGVSPVTPEDVRGEDRQRGTLVGSLGRERQARQRSPHPRRWGDRAPWRHQGAENHCTSENRVVQQSTMPTHRHGSVPARVWHLMRSVLAHGRATCASWACDPCGALLGGTIDRIGASLFLLVAAMGPLAETDVYRTRTETQRQKLGRKCVWHIALVNTRSSSVEAWQA